MKYSVKNYINAALYWIFPQDGMIACLQRKVRAQEDLILTIKADRQTIRNENAKLEEALRRMEAERDEARYRVAELTAVAEAEDALVAGTR